MNTAEVDLDRLVDYEREYRSVVKKGAGYRRSYDRTLPVP